MTIAGHAYPVQLAPDFAGLGAAIPGKPGPCVVVSNPVVAPLHAPALLAELGSAGWAPRLLEVPDGEVHKDLRTWAALVDDVLDQRVDRRTPILALGGGVTGDLVGFAAATALRGLPFVQVPTTLLAMVDASVGGKTGVNARQGKNLVGAFHQPELVWAALHTLTTLPHAELRCGLGEVVKHALISGESDLARLEADATALHAGDAVALARAVAFSVQVKAAIVAEDPLERGRRAILNLGHTLGHGIEQVLGYGVLRHGEAVGLGLLGVLRWSARNGHARESHLPERVEALLRTLDLPIEPPAGLDRALLVTALGFDKKRAHGKLRIALPLAPGDIVLHDIPLEQIPSLVDSLFPPSEDRC